jgi:hypothetical protein
MPMTLMKVTLSGPGAANFIETSNYPLALPAVESSATTANNTAVTGITPIQLTLTVD